MKYLLGLCALIFLFSCNTFQKVNSKYSTIEYAVFEAEHFNFNDKPSKDEFSKPREGTFKGTIKEEDYNQLISLLDGLNVKGLNDKYGEHNITDLPTSYLRMKFADGTSKNVEDYGKRGSEKLSEVYKFFENLRKNQQWTKVK